MTTHRLSVFAFLLAILLSFNLVALAHEQASYGDLGGEPKLLPTSKLHAIKELGWNLQHLFAWTQNQKLRLELSIATSRLAEIKKMSETAPDALEAIGSSSDAYRVNIERATSALDALIENKNDTTKAVAQFGAVADFHQKVFDELTENTKISRNDLKDTDSTFERGLLRALEVASNEAKPILLRVVQMQQAKNVSATTTTPDTAHPDEILCTAEYDPVCGVNNKTYSNACEANRVQVKVATKGTCVKPSPIETKCIVSGCSGQICQSSDSEPAITTCEFKDEYACYKTAKCEIQTSGKCGWTDTPSLGSCIDAARAQSSSNNPPSLAVPTTPVPKNISATIENFKYISAEIRVPLGSTVTWTNKDGPSHTVTSDNGKFASATLATGQAFSFTFNEKGTFPYHCDPHPWMKATVVVE